MSESNLNVGTKVRITSLGEDWSNKAKDALEGKCGVITESAEVEPFYTLCHDGYSIHWKRCLRRVSFDEKVIVSPTIVLDNFVFSVDELERLVDCE